MPELSGKGIELKLKIHHGPLKSRNESQGISWRLRGLSPLTVATCPDCPSGLPRSQCLTDNPLGQKVMSLALLQTLESLCPQSGPPGRSRASEHIGGAQLGYTGSPPARLLRRCRVTVTAPPQWGPLLRAPLSAGCWWMRLWWQRTRLCAALRMKTQSGAWLSGAAGAPGSLLFSTSPVRSWVGWRPACAREGDSCGMMGRRSWPPPSSSLTPPPATL